MRARNKNGRREVIKMIISSHEVTRQRELMDELSKAGHPCTQATLSRDLSELKVLRVRNLEGGNVYVLPETQVYRKVSDTQMSVKALHSMGVLNIKFSGNIAVVRTLPGHAAHVAYDIDNAKIGCVLGTVAGEDTIFVALVDGTLHKHALDAISGIIKHEENERIK